ERREVEKKELEKKEPSPVPVAVTPVTAKQAPVQVTLTASERSWVSVWVDGKNQFAGEMKANEKRTVSNGTNVKLITANAGALKITLNGKALDPVGPKGQMLVLELTDAGVHVVPRTPPNPLP
ncbi:MAG: DUF4115 domain-containing protein, partial [Acidobacteriota bacterium]|nr:DUF4115 domain-containing protein [Acidobacteriota bacterium]